MTGPIDTITVLGTNTMTLKSQASWSPKINTNLRVYPQTVSFLKCPATVNNPVRPDGTRKRSPWSKQWYRYAGRITSFEIREKPGKSAWRYNGTSWDLTFVAGFQTANPWSSVVTAIPFDPVIQLTADNAARTKTLLKVGQKKWDLGVAAVELHQTAGLVTELAVSMATTVEKLIHSRAKVRTQVDNFFRRVRKHGDFTKAAAEVGMRDLSLLEDLRGKWMQYQFGIRPLIYDVNNAVNALSTMVVDDAIPMVVTAKAGHQDRRNVLTAVLGNQSGCYSAKLLMEQVCAVHYSVEYVIPTGQVSPVTTLGLDAPGPLFWEVTRLSWMADYVVGIGDWLQSMTAAKGLEFREGSKSMLLRASAISMEVTPLFDSSKQQLVKPWSTRAPYCERGSFQRTLLPSTGVVPAVVPQIKSTLGLVQMANSIFALSSVLGGSPGLR